MAVPEVQKLAQALSQEYNKPNPDLAKCGQYLTQLKVQTALDWSLGGMTVPLGKSSLCLADIPLQPLPTWFLDCADRAPVLDTRRQAQQHRGTHIGA